MLRVVAIIALIAATSAEIFEYSEQKHLEMPIFNPEAEVIIPKVINPDIKRIIKRVGREVEEDAASFFFDRTPNNENGKHPICKDSLGIDFSNVGGSVFCELNPIRMRLRTDKKKTSGKHFMVLSLGFGFSTENNLLVLEVPVFNTPSEYASSDQDEQFEKWASDNELATVYPFDTKQLDDLITESKSTIDFNWLEKLISLGVSVTPHPVIMQKEDITTRAHSFITRPLVLSKDYTTKLTDIVQDAQAKTAATSSS